MAPVARKFRFSPIEAAYALTVGVLAALGFGAGSTVLIALAALVTFPSSALAVPAYYLAYGLLALVPGANPSISTGSGTCSAAGACTVTVTGQLASWFVVASALIGILALLAAAVANVALLRRLTARRPPRMAPPGGGV
ncbi:MAG: hypothetical protein V9G08_09325 [Dermatophilaceae bacterium]